MINKKWKNSITNSRAYRSFKSIASDHKIVIAHLKLSLRSNKSKTTKQPIYDCKKLKEYETKTKFISEVLTKFEILNDESSDMSMNTK